MCRKCYTSLDVDFSETWQFPSVEVIVHVFPGCLQKSCALLSGSFVVNSLHYHSAHKTVIVGICVLDTERSSLS